MLAAGHAYRRARQGRFPGVYAVKKGMTITEIAETWAPYLTMAEGIELAAQTLTRDVSRLSCCAA